MSKSELYTHPSRIASGAASPNTIRNAVMQSVHMLKYLSDACMTEDLIVDAIGRWGAQVLDYVSARQISPRVAAAVILSDPTYYEEDLDKESIRAGLQWIEMH